MSEIVELLNATASGGPVVLWDGAVGTQLLARGLTGKVPELWQVDEPDALTEIHADYLRAGSQVVQTNTFGATGIKLAMNKIGDRLEQVNKAAVEVAKAAVDRVGHGLVAGDIGPCGQMLQPSGPLSPEEAEKTFAEQAKILAEAGADFISIETMFDLEEAMAAVRGAKSVCDLPVVAHMTYNKTPRGFFTMMGVTPEAAAEGLKGAGAIAIGANCNIGMPEMIELTKIMKTATDLPIIAQANAGNPEVVKGETVYTETADNFASHAPALRQAGASAIGACCGSTPEFIAALQDKLRP